MSSRFPTFVVIAFLLLGAFSPLTAGDNKWTSNGPYGGRFNHFAFDPRADNVVFAAGNSGLYRSRDGGRKWQLLASSPGGVVRIHPRDPERIVVAGCSVATSSDGGNTWQEIAGDPFGGDGPLLDMEFHPTDPRSLYGITRPGRVFMSTDGGATWEARCTGLPIHGTIKTQLEISPVDGQTIYVTSNGKVFKTTAGGQSWVCASLGLGSDLQALEIDPKDPETLYITDPFYKTTDGGQHWWSLGQSGGQNYLAVDAQNPQNVYATGTSGVLRSTNGGTTWTRLDVDPNQCELEGIAVHPRKGNLVLVGGVGQGIFRTQNAGKTWQQVNHGLDSSDIVHLVATSKGLDRILALSNYGVGLYETRDQGNTWASLSFGGYSQVGDVQVHEKDSDLIVASGYFVLEGTGRALAVSTDGGRSWTFKSPYPGGRRVALDPRDKNVIFLATEDFPNATGMAKSTDRGETWQPINDGLTDKAVQVIALDRKNASFVLVGTATGKIFTSTNGGANWLESSRGLHGGGITSIAFHPKDSRVLYASSSDGMYRSSDSGQTWTLKSRDGSPVVVVDRSNPHTVFAGTYGGVLVSTDDAENWSTFDTRGLGPFGVSDILLDPSTPGRLIIGTVRGVFSYTLKGSAGGPLIEQLSPSAGRSGDTVTINGKGFGRLQRSSRVLFGTLDAGIAQSWSDSSIKVTVPAGVRTGSVTVTVLGKKSNPFEFIALPTSGNIEPTSGPAAGGTRVTILAPRGTSGTQFNVLFGSTVAANVRFTQPNVITCDSPPGTGTVDVKVTSSVTSTTVGTFTYQ